MSISDVLKIKLFWGATTISFCLECRLVRFTWILILLLPFVVVETFGCRKIKFRDVSASDISPMSGTCVNLLASIRIFSGCCRMSVATEWKNISCVIISGLRGEVALNEEIIFQL